MVAEGQSAGRLRRLTRAAMSADSAIKNAEGVALSATTLLDDLSVIVERLDSAEIGLEDLIADCRREVAGLGHTRREAHTVVEQVQRILELVDWFLTPAYVAREKIDRANERIAEIRLALLRRVAGAPDTRHNSQVVDLAEVRRRAG